jgi:anthranilate synthase component 2
VVEVARYHSLIAEKNTLPDTLEVTSEDMQGEIMGVKVKGYEVYGLQFHPESVLTTCGDTILRNFLNIKL